jgi:hypothetical protein
MFDGSPWVTDPQSCCVFSYPKIPALTSNRISSLVRAHLGTNVDPFNSCLRRACYHSTTLSSSILPAFLQYLNQPPILSFPTSLSTFLLSTFHTSSSTSAPSLYPGQSHPANVITSVTDQQAQHDRLNSFTLVTPSTSRSHLNPSSPSDPFQDPHLDLTNPANAFNIIKSLSSFSLLSCHKGHLSSRSIDLSHSLLSTNHTQRKQNNLHSRFLLPNQPINQASYHIIQSSPLNPARARNPSDPSLLCTAS